MQPRPRRLMLRPARPLPPRLRRRLPKQRRPRQPRPTRPRRRKPRRMQHRQTRPRQRPQRLKPHESMQPRPQRSKPMQQSPRRPRRPLPRSPRARRHQRRARQVRNPTRMGLKQTRRRKAGANHRQDRPALSDTTVSVEFSTGQRSRGLKVLQSHHHRHSWSPRLASWWVMGCT